jgi:CRISPR-associated protein Cmr4
MAQSLLFIHALTPLHAGTGQGVGAIDLPIQRERATNLPLLPGSTIKGCLRDSMEKDPLRDVLFGTASNEDTTAGMLHISDASLLLFPVRCLGATFVWTTSPFLLRRFSRVALAAGAAGLPGVPVVNDESAAMASHDATVKLDGKPRLILEDLDFDPGSGPSAEAQQWCDWLSSRIFPANNDPWRDEMKKRFAIVDDKSFDFLAEFATEVAAHIRIDQAKGTVEDGALWYQEALPAESILAGLLQVDQPRRAGLPGAAALLDAVNENGNIQFGGKASTGMGFARFVPSKV